MGRPFRSRTTTATVTRSALDLKHRLLGTEAGIRPGECENSGHNDERADPIEHRASPKIPAGPCGVSQRVSASTTPLFIDLVAKESLAAVPYRCLCQGVRSLFVGSGFSKGTRVFRWNSDMSATIGDTGIEHIHHRPEYWVENDVEHLPCDNQSHHAEGLRRHQKLLITPRGVIR